MKSKREIKDIVTKVIPLVGIIIIGAFIFQVIKRPIKDVNNVANIVSLDKLPSDTVRDDKRQLHAQKEYILVPDYALAEAMYSGIIDSLKNELKLSKKAQVSSGGIVTSTTQVKFVPEVRKSDSIVTHYTFKDKWVDLSLSVDTGKLSTLEYRDSLIFGTIKERYGFLGLKERQFFDVRSSNPNVKHIGVTYFEVAPTRNNKSKVGFGLGVGPTITINKENKVEIHKLGVQFGIQYRF